MNKTKLFLVFSIIVLSLPLTGFLCNDCDECDDSPPTVVSTTPADGETGVAQAAVLSVTFSEPIDVTTVTINKGAGCIGSIRVFRESDGYCTQLDTVTISNLNKTFTITHAVFPSGTWKIKVTTDVRNSSSGNNMPYEYVHSTGFTVP